MKVMYAIVENCYVAGRFEEQENFNEFTEPVVLIKHGLFKSITKACVKATRLNKLHKGNETVEHFTTDEEELAFGVIELELNKDI